MLFRSLDGQVRAQRATRGHGYAAAPPAAALLGPGLQIQPSRRLGRSPAWRAPAARDARSRRYRRAARDRQLRTRPVTAGGLGADSDSADSDAATAAARGTSSRHGFAGIRVRHCSPPWLAIQFPALAAPLPGGRRRWTRLVSWRQLRVMG